MTPPRVLFLGLAYAGHRTRFENLVAHTSGDVRIRGTYRAVTGWQSGGRIEQLPLLPAGVKGRLRATVEASAMATMPRPDVIWSSVAQVAAPFMWSEVGPLRRPRIQDLDCTFDQLEEWAPIYYNREPHSGWRRRSGQLMERALFRNVTLFTPWSNWAADGLQRLGIPRDRIRVLPPGVDLSQWRPTERVQREGPLRLLFVGGNFERKGGMLLLDVLRGRFAGRCELDVVTRDEVPATPGMRVHRTEANSPELLRLYAQADLFVLPTRAECFGIATVEALASGLPAIMSDVGGAADIVDHGATGWLIQPTAASLSQALEEALVDRGRLLEMGRRARAVAEQRFDGAKNDATIVDLVLGEAKRFGARSAAPAVSVV
ncbi:MAG: glycosyltransferase family 4 protein [Chloroflexi bacterium]|nr:glycosyltransferase family 4 protein [Chloroflexota bacterium]